MNLLLDTHSFLWFLDGSIKLSPKARELIEDQKNAKLLSVASLWEIGIKMSLGRLSFANSFEEFIPRQIEMNGFVLLPLRIAHIAKVASLPFHHRDPFDRLLIAQCIVEELSLVSIDLAFDKYSACRLW